MLAKAVFANFTEADLPNELWNRASGVANEIKLVQRDDPEFSSELIDADALILRLGMEADASLMDDAPNLRYIGMLGTGYGRIDVDTAKARQIIVTNVADYSTESVAELVVGMAITALRDLDSERQRAQSGNVNETDFLGKELQTQTIGVIGAGFIGQRVMQIMSDGFGSQVLYWSRNRRPSIESSRVAYAELPDLLSQSDILTIHLAANDETDQLFNADRIATLKSGALLINTSPNEIVDLEATKKRCLNGQLTYCMDHADELDQTAFDSLRATPNVHIYPPIGYATSNASKRKLEILVANLESFVAGKPQNHVNP